MTKKVQLPLTSEAIGELKAGDSVLLNGWIYVARDAAHKRLHEALKNKKPLPINLENESVYYMGPSPTPPGKVIGAAGPTTSHRMDKYTPELLELGLKGMVGKGARTQPVVEAIRENGAVYFCAVGGAGALLQNAIVKNELVCYPELGPEALRRIKLKDFPAVVAIDALGGNLYTNQEALYGNRWKTQD